MAVIPTDDLFSQQWYLHNTVSGQFDLNVLDAWDDYTGKGVVVAVMDSGVDYAHSDIAPNYDTANDYDYGRDDEDPSPTDTSLAEAHGTAVAGIIGAARGNGGVVGVAYESTLVAYRYEATALQTNRQHYVDVYVEAITDAADKNVDIVNMSFGHYEIYGSYFTAAQLQAQGDALAYAVENGRDGLGTILVKAAGNERAIDVDANAAEVRNDTHQIIVAAVDRDGSVVAYSTYGAPALVSAFGSPYQGTIVTTDETGTNGYDSGNYTTSFNGTSAAAPQISGVVALMLEANSSLGWRDAQTILAYSARHVGSDVDGTSTAGNERYAWTFNAAANWNGGGLHFSEDYGYGLVDARAAVRLAEAWTGVPGTSANEKTLTLDLLDASEPLPDANLTGMTFSADAGGSVVVERVTVDLAFQTAASNDLDFYLIGPDGVERRLAGDVGGNETVGYSGTFTFQSAGFRGVSSKGEWSVRAVDDRSGNLITLSDIKIQLHGAADSKNDIYIYTDEFSAFLDTHSRTLRDTDGGTDLLNAAAVTAAMQVDLTKGKGTIDGVAINIKGIENACAGDGNDRLVGSKGNNDLAGGRGIDTLTGGKGNDDFRFWHISDSKVDAFDRITDFGKGKDHIDLRRIDADTLTDGNGKFDFIGRNDFSLTAGELHVYKSAGKTFVAGDIDGDGFADFAIALNGNHNLVKGDFIL